MVRNTSGNGPGLPIQVINLPGGRPCILLSVENFVALLGFARLGAAREEAPDDAHFAWLPISTDDSDPVSKKTRTAVANVLRDDDAMFDIDRVISAGLYDPYRAVRAATTGAVQPIMPFPDSEEDAEEDAEDAADLAAYQEAKARDEEAFPLALAQRLVAGDHPVKVFREHRGMTQAQLAEEVGLTAMYLSQVETRRRNASTKALRRIAAALDVDLADLLE